MTWFERRRHLTRDYNLTILRAAIDESNWGERKKKRRVKQERNIITNESRRKKETPEKKDRKFFLKIKYNEGEEGERKLKL